MEDTSSKFIIEKRKNGIAKRSKRSRKSIDLSTRELSITLYLSLKYDDDTIKESIELMEDLDLTDINTLHIKTKADELEGNDSRLKIWVDGIEVFSTENTHGWTDRNFDVSDVTGIKTLGLGGNIAGSFGPDVHSWADIRLE